MGSEQFKVIGARPGCGQGGAGCLVTGVHYHQQGWQRACVRSAKV